MARYFTAARIREAINALSDTKGKATLLDFLIVKRTLVIKKQAEVAITQGEPSYIQATKELAGVWDKDIDIRASKEIFNVFASKDKRQGYRGGKYISNGTGSTIGGNPWQAVIALKTDTDPRLVSFRPGHEKHLADLLLKESPKTQKPSLTEIAIWNYRRTDLDPLLGSEKDPVKRSAIISNRFIADYGLSTGEIAELFESTVSKIEDTDLDTIVADPRTYLVGISTPSAASVSSAAKFCSLDLTAALAAKPFVILTGTSGTGKSRSALSLAEQLQTLYGASAESQIFQLVPIGPDWTSPKKLLGYRTPFGAERIRPDGTKTNEGYEVTESLRIILRACHPNSTKIPHFLIFDEMNLSHVERYFAPFLSLMEAANILEDGENAPVVDRQSLTVISELLDLEDKLSVEAQSARLLVKNDQPLKLPHNLFYIGTVNVDETTYMFSPKVLDRAHVLEIKARTPSDYVYGTGATEAMVALEIANEMLREAIDSREENEESESNPASILKRLEEKHSVPKVDVESAAKLTLTTLDGCFELLAPTGFEFGFRVVNEVHVYMYVWIKAQLAMGDSPAQAMSKWVDGLDRAIFQKVLPKIHGNRAALGDSLKALSAFLNGHNAGDDPPAKYALGIDNVVEIESGKEITLPPGASFGRCKAKLADMQVRLVSRNHVSFVQ